MSPALMKGAPSGSIGKASEYAKPSQDRKCLLILDGHSSHKTLEAVNYARDHGIVIFVLPPHTTHKLQPLDRTFFEPLKANYNKEPDKWMLMNPGNKPDSGPGTSDAVLPPDKPDSEPGTSDAVLPPDKPDSGPGTSDAVLPPDKPDSGPGTSDAVLPPDKPDSGPETSDAVLPPDKPDSEPGTSDAVLPPDKPDSGPGTSDAVLPPDKPGLHASTLTELTAGPSIEPQQDVRRQIEVLSPLPVKRKIRSRKRKSDSSMVVTSSPFKKMMEEKGQKRSKKTSTKANKKVADESEVWHCLYCNELYTEPPTEDWLQCIKCRQWFLAECGDEKDICDLCC
ncbi:mucin-5AC-like [Haliotis rufescens]|uniref:mucin-5AC-like n=1 Tax=Haliotis rufescens TaxID=6454 RepID=UPI00201F0669|nr:mucin-5AC-like [Haliotis rufescens]